LCLCGESPAQLDPEANKPYQLRVVLSVADHRMLTPSFQKQLESDLQAQLRLAFGKLADVKVVRGHPLLSDIHARGLGAVLAAWDEVSEQETVFVLVDFRDGHYALQVGQHSGMTGLSGPGVRTLAVANRQHVAAEAARLIHRDFGLVGTVAEVTPQGVHVVLKGGALAGDLKDWVKKGDIFAAAKMSRTGDKLQAERIEWAVLQAIQVPQDGAVLCRYMHRWQADELEVQDPVVGFRCVKLPTTHGPVQLRLVDKADGRFLAGKEIQLSATPAFDGKSQGATDVNGLFTSKQSFDNVVYVRVQSGAQALAQFPVEIVGDRVVVVQLGVDEKAEQSGQVEQRRDRWLQQLYDALGVADKRVKELNDLITVETLDEALKLAKKSYQALTDELERFRKERSALLELSSKVAPGLQLGQGDNVVRTLTQIQEKLHNFVVDVDKKIQAKSSKETLDLEAKLKQAGILEQQAEFDKAIKLYEAVGAAAKLSDEVLAHLKQLKTAWEARDRPAADFFYNVWPGLDLAGLKANLGKAREMFERCKTAGDFKTPQKLLHVNNGKHAPAVLDRIKALRQAPDLQNQPNELKGLIELSGELHALQNQVTAWVVKDKK
jgi:hypothetical protein